jgi:hypothetical protein
LGVLNDSADSPGGVAWWAHLGGFAAGLVMLPLLNENTRQLTKVVAEETQTLRPDRFYQPGRSTDYRFPLPLADVQPGKYAAIFEITSGARSITRGIRFVVR